MTSFPSPIVSSIVCCGKYRCCNCHSSFCSINTAAMSRRILASFGKIPTTLVRRFASFVEPLKRVGRVQLDSVRCREMEVRQNIRFCLIH